MSEYTMLQQRYRLLSQQGSGGMAVVYKAHDEGLDRVVALKIMRPNYSNDEASRERFRKEARHIAQLQHPNIVTVHDFLTEADRYVLVMEYIEGQDLKRLLRDRGALSIQQALDIAIQVSEGLGYAHRRNLVHSDVKPQNVLLTSDGRAKITDFGIAQVFRRAAPKEKRATVWGSPHYFAPEQALGAAPTPECDIYAMGIVLFEMLTGRLPYRGEDQKELALAHVREPIPRVSDQHAHIPQPLVNIVYKLMSKDAAARYRSGDQLAHVLKAYRDSGSQSTIQNDALSAMMHHQPTVSKGNTPAKNGTSRPYTGRVSPRNRPRHARAQQWDLVTMMMALLALLAVGGLLLLYASLITGSLG
ncbi:MAG: serine/threonine-protein kinase [Anaerolineaceae bacterium]|nr:serine/threonine-protein kinase [Anaerolineaceae bacterium]MCY4105469.1 serine/threonine-protein kinase [Chloroflexota bacterium]